MPKTKKHSNNIAQLIDFAAILAFVYFILSIKSMKITDPSIFSIIVTAFAMTTYHFLYPYWNHIIIKWFKVSFLMCWILICFALLGCIIWHFKEINQYDFNSGLKKDLTIPGILLSDRIDNTNTIDIDCGAFTRTFNISLLIDSGIVVPLPSLCIINKRFAEAPLVLKLKLIYNRLVVSTTITDIEHGEEVAEIKDNQISIIKPYVLDWNISADNKKFEMIDKENNVVFSISLVNSNTIKIRGYFISESYVTVIGDSTILACAKMNDYQEKRNAIIAIEGISKMNKQ